MCECHRRVGELFSVWLQICAVIFTWPLLEDLSMKKGGEKSDDFTDFEGMSIFCSAGTPKISIWGLEYITSTSERMN